MSRSQPKTSMFNDRAFQDQQLPVTSHLFISLPTLSNSPTVGIVCAFSCSSPTPLPPSIPTASSRPPASFRLLARTSSPPHVCAPHLQLPASSKLAQTNSSPQPRLPSPGQRAREEKPGPARNKPTATVCEQRQGTRQSPRSPYWQGSKGGLVSRPSQRQFPPFQDARLGRASPTVKEETPAPALSAPTAAASGQRQGTRQSLRWCWPGTRRGVVSSLSRLSHLQVPPFQDVQMGRVTPTGDLESRWVYWTGQWATAGRRRGPRERRQP